MPRWKFVAEFRRERREPTRLECFVAIPDAKEARQIAAKKLAGADQIKSAQEIPDAELRAAGQGGYIAMTRDQENREILIGVVLVLSLAIGMALYQRLF